MLQLQSVAGAEISKTVRNVIKYICDPAKLHSDSCWAGSHKTKKAAWKELRNLKQLFVEVVYTKHATVLDEKILRNAIQNVLRNTGTESGLSDMSSQAEDTQSEEDYQEDQDQEDQD